MNIKEIGIDNFGDTFVKAIEANNIQLAHTMSTALVERVHTNPDDALWLATPVNLTKIHVAITEHMAISPRVLMLKNRVPSPVRRAALLARAIDIAIGRLDV